MLSISLTDAERHTAIRMLGYAVLTYERWIREGTGRVEQHKSEVAQAKLILRALAQATPAKP